MTERVFRADSSTSERTEFWMPQFCECFKGMQTVCDVGCGQGNFLRLLSKSGMKNIYGFEASPELAEKLNKEGFKVICGDVLETLKNYENFFDGIYSSHLIEHLITKDALVLLELMKNALKNKGKLVIITPNIMFFEYNAKGIFWRDFTHQRPYNIESLTGIVKKAGFTVKKKGEIEKNKRSAMTRIKYRLREFICGVKLRGDYIYVECEK